MVLARTSCMVNKNARVCVQFLTISSIAHRGEKHNILYNKTKVRSELACLIADPMSSRFLNITTNIQESCKIGKNLTNETFLLLC